MTRRFATDEYAEDANYDEVNRQRNGTVAAGVMRKRTGNQSAGIEVKTTKAENRDQSEKHRKPAHSHRSGKAEMHESAMTTRKRAGNLNVKPTPNPTIAQYKVTHK